MAEDDNDSRQAKAMARYQIISAYLALEPIRGQKRPLLEQLASKLWQDERGEPLAPQAETIRSWIRRYRRGGLKGLEDKPHPRRGVSVLAPDQIELCCQLKREVPERSLDRILEILEGTKLVEPGVVRRSTLHRVLAAHGLSARKCEIPDSQDLDRFEADAPNDLWQSDMLVGPWLADPDRPGKPRRAYLYAFLDDHSRLVLHGRFSFKGDLPALELVFRRALQKYGRCRRVYYDNGQTYRSIHMRQIVATIGIHRHRPIFTQRYRPMGHGKIEALNRLIRSAFLAELKSSRITTLDALNEAFVAWVDTSYNRKVHGETGQVPLQRWRAGIERIEYADEERLRQAFLWREHRSPDKAGIFSLFGCKYQVGPDLARKRRRIEVRYDPEGLHEIEVFSDGKFAERVRPFHVQSSRRPRKSEPTSATAQRTSAEPPSTPTVDWLGHLVEKRRRERGALCEPTVADLTAQALAARTERDDAIVRALAERLDPAAFDEAAARDYLRRFGPFDPVRAKDALERLFAGGERADHHVRFYLDAIRDHAMQTQGRTP